MPNRATRLTPFAAGVVLALLSWTSTSARASCKDHTVQPARGHFYLCYELTAAGIDFTPEPRFLDGGQFEVRIPRDKFPIPAPKCRSSIILRMPWTDPKVEDTSAKVEDKRKLFDAVMALKAGGSQSVPIMIDLAPYVREVARDPLQLELTQCNVFFAQKAGAVVLP
jgi:hypothetical protein